MRVEPKEVKERISLIFHSLAITALIIFLSNCGFVPFYAGGEKFNPGRTSDLVKGQSTREDVLRLFGEPLESSTADLAQARWWRYSYEYLGNLGVQRAALEVYFKDNVVDDYKLDMANTRY
jgi:hypothetical protein